MSPALIKLDDKYVMLDKIVYFDTYYLHDDANGTKHLYISFDGSYGSEISDGGLRFPDDDGEKLKKLKEALLAHYHYSHMINNYIEDINETLILILKKDHEEH